MCSWSFMGGTAFSICCVHFVPPSSVVMRYRHVTGSTRPGGQALFNNDGNNRGGALEQRDLPSFGEQYPLVPSSSYVSGALEILEFMELKWPNAELGVA